MKQVDIFEIDPMDVTFEPLAGSTFTNLLRLLAQNKFHVDPIGIPRIVYSIALSFALSPLNLIESIKYDKKTKKTKITKPPIFIVGHWRTGSTYLHNLLSQDKQFGYPTTFQTVTPALLLGFEKFVKPIVESSLPETRPQDNVELGADLPQEEEYALGNISPYSFYNGWIFPKNMDLYNNYVDFQNVSEKEIKEFKKIFHFYVQKLTLYYKGKQLLLKNPSNTARIKLLHDMYPNAKFIHIHRNPYHVYLSMKRNIEKEMILYTLQTPPSWEVFEKAMVDMYNRMFDKYFKEIKLVPKENQIDVKYEELMQNPLIEIEKIYRTLNIDGFDTNKETFKRYIDSQKKIKAYSYKIDQETKDKIYHYLKETIDLWNYTI
jgi:omega-hydroxy-beta-dihydromenaquinone-9 sulfotransferase